MFYDHFCSYWCVISWCRQWKVAGTVVLNCHGGGRENGSLVGTVVPVVVVGTVAYKFQIEGGRGRDRTDWGVGRSREGGGSERQKNAFGQPDFRTTLLYFSTWGRIAVCTNRYLKYNTVNLVKYCTEMTAYTVQYILSYVRVLCGVLVVQGTCWNGTILNIFRYISFYLHSFYFFWMNIVPNMKKRLAYTLDLVYYSTGVALMLKIRDFEKSADVLCTGTYHDVYCILYFNLKHRIPINVHWLHVIAKRYHYKTLLQLLKPFIFMYKWVRTSFIWMDFFRVETATDFLFVPLLDLSISFNARLVKAF